MDVSAMAQGFYILITLLLLALSEIQCKAKNLRWNQKRAFHKCLKQTVERECKPYTYLKSVSGDDRKMWNKLSENFQPLNQKWSKKWRNSLHTQYTRNRKFYRKFWKSFACLWRSAQRCGSITKTYDVRLFRNNFDCLWDSGRVCGVDGKNYRSACHAARLGVNIQYRGKCSSKWMLDERVPLCYDLPCLCKFTREPDACCFKHVRRKECEEVLSKWEALCNGTAVCGCDYCDEGYSPVCSRTGNTYHNLCKLGCVDDEEFACNGTCPCSPTPGPPVCGSDGVTYPSPEEALKGKVAISCDGPCPCSTDCVCNDTSDPVCGEDDVTYDNACKAICSDVSVACNKSCPCPKTLCQCDDVAEPVCGSDAKTYLNSCEAICAGVEIACQTCCPCPEIAPTCTFCDYNYKFVCGKDNTTYANECCASCAGIEVTQNAPCRCQT
ncbi:serine protease inhibitor dipetalogastin [Magallana gigas]|uniref:serine protease inhibitor dipetalogastin n=1 Tax=Magallana gigas TaxID=29159 RepID=UPI00333ECEE9